MNVWAYFSVLVFLEISGGHCLVWCPRGISTNHWLQSWCGCICGFYWLCCVLLGNKMVSKSWNQRRRQWIWWSTPDVGVELTDFLIRVQNFCTLNVFRKVPVFCVNAISLFVEICRWSKFGYDFFRDSVRSIRIVGSLLMRASCAVGEIFYEVSIGANPQHIPSNQYNNNNNNSISKASRAL